MTSVIEEFWRNAEARDWATFAALLAEDVVYELPQTGERITGRQAYLKFNVEYPGDWHVEVQRVHADATGGASWIGATVAGEHQHALTFFRFDAAGLISEVIDFWPEPYERPTGREHLVDVERSDH